MNHAARKAIKKLSKESGLKVVDSRESKAHIKVTAESPDGRVGVFFLSSSASDGRTNRNQLADWKRFANGG